MPEAAPRPEQVRATQSLVSHMSFCWRHPSLTILEIGWRWLFGVPFLALLWMQGQSILDQIPPSTTGLARLSFQNPWLSSVLLADAAGTYEPAVAAVLVWLAPAALVAWAVISGVGRTLVWWRHDSLSAEGVESSLKPQLGAYLRRAPGVMLLQGLWMAALLLCFWLWFRSVSWAATTYLVTPAEPELVAYLCWLIFLSLGFYIAWAVTSWTLAAAPLLYLREDRSIFATIGQSFRPGKTFSAKLVEINLVTAIVKIMLIVLAMVFAAAPLPFADQFGPGAMNWLYVVVAVAYLVWNDYFHLVRMRSFAALWQAYRGHGEPA